MPCITLIFKHGSCNHPPTHNKICNTHIIYPDNPDCTYVSIRLISVGLPTARMLIVIYKSYQSSRSMLERYILRWRLPVSPLVIIIIIQIDTLGMHIVRSIRLDCVMFFRASKQSEPSSRNTSPGRCWR